MTTAMDDLSAISSVRKINLLICFYDIENFASIARDRPDPVEIFDILNGMAKITHGKIDGSPGHVVKFIGDSALLIFPEGAEDEGVNLLLQLKDELETFFGRQGCSTRTRFNVHFGEVAVGPFGVGRRVSLDVFGDSVNTAAMLGRGQHRGRFVISPEAFAHLSAATQKRFHRYTPPIVYLAEERPDLR